MKKIYLAICIFTLIACLTGISYLIEGITKRGLMGVNYGRVIFPLLVSGFFFRLYKNHK